MAKVLAYKTCWRRGDDGPWRAFLSFGRGAVKRFPPPTNAVSAYRADFPHGLSSPGRLSKTDLSFTARGGYSKRAAIPKASTAEEAVSAPSRRSAVSALPYGPSLPAGQSQAGRRGTFTGQSCLPLCPGETANHLPTASRITACPDLRPVRGQRFSRMRSLASSTGRIAIPPELACPGPSVTARCRTGAGCIPRFREFETRLPYRRGPARVRLDFSGSSF